MKVDLQQSSSLATSSVLVLSRSESAVQSTSAIRKLIAVHHRIVYGFNKNNNDFAFVKTLNTELFKIIKKHSSGNPVLIFCSTRKSCLEAAEQLVKDYKETLNSSSRPASLAWPKPPRTSYTVNDKRLAALIESGVSTHHAGMDQQDRKLVEKLFLEGKISIICQSPPRSPSQSCST